MFLKKKTNKKEPSRPHKPAAPAAPAAPTGTPLATRALLAGICITIIAILFSCHVIVIDGGANTDTDTDTGDGEVTPNTNCQSPQSSTSRRTNVTPVRFLHNHGPASLPTQGDGYFTKETCNAPSAIAFDTLNRPYMIFDNAPSAFGNIYTIRNNEIVALEFADDIAQHFAVGRNNVARDDGNIGHARSCLSIDESNRLYLVTSFSADGDADLEKTGLIYLHDINTEDFKVYPLDNAYTACLQHYRRNAPLIHPPVITYLEKVGHSRISAWADTHGKQYFIFPTVNTDGTLDLSKKAQIGGDHIAAREYHSGLRRFMVTPPSTLGSHSGHHTFITYNELVGGVWYKGNRIIIAKVDNNNPSDYEVADLGWMYPINANIHANTVMDIDTSGHLHIIATGHATPSKYLATTSTNGNISADQWSPAITYHENETYGSMVIDSADYIHLTVRRRHEGENGGKLDYTRYSTAAARQRTSITLVDCQSGVCWGYAIYYHRMFIDRKDNLYVSAQYYDLKHTGYPRILLTTPAGNSYQSNAWNYPLITDF